MDELVWKDVIILEFKSSRKSGILKDNRVVSHKEFELLVNKNMQECINAKEDGKVWYGVFSMRKFLFVVNNKTFWIDKNISINDLNEIFNMNHNLFQEMLVYQNYKYSIFLKKVYIKNMVYVYNDYKKENNYA